MKECGEVLNDMPEKQSAPDHIEIARNDQKFSSTSLKSTRIFLNFFLDRI